MNHLAVYHALTTTAGIFFIGYGLWRRHKKYIMFRAEIGLGVGLILGTILGRILN